MGEVENKVNERLALFIKHLRMSVRAFERSIDVKNGYVKRLTEDMSAANMLRMCRLYPSLNPYWLIFGEGAMLLPAADEGMAVRRAYLRGKVEGYEEAQRILEEGYLSHEKGRTA